MVCEETKSKCHGTRSIYSLTRMEESHSYLIWLRGCFPMFHYFYAYVCMRASAVLLKFYFCLKGHYF